MLWDAVASKKNKHEISESFVSIPIDFIADIIFKDTKSVHSVSPLSLIADRH